MANCADGVVTWDWIDAHLKGAGWGGPYTHDSDEAQVYEQTANCTPQIAGYNAAGAPTSPVTPTTPGAKGPTNPSGSSGLDGILSQATTFVNAHPLESVGIAFVAGYLLLGGRR